MTDRPEILDAAPVTPARPRRKPKAPPLRRQPGPFKGKPHPSIAARLSRALWGRRP